MTICNILNTDIELLKQVIDYNKNRYYCNKNGIVFDKNKEFERILCARYMKVSRVKKRLFYLLVNCKYIWFCTFTFNENYINKCDRTKKDLIKKCINNLDFKYILNIDYGKTTEREHYHCIIGTNWNLDLNDYIKKIYPCHCLALKCNTQKNDLVKLTKYINKLTNHCVKSTTKRQRIIYNFKGFEFASDTHSNNLAYKLFFDSYFEDVSLT